MGAAANMASKLPDMPIMTGAAAAEPGDANVSNAAGTAPATEMGGLGTGDGALLCAPMAIVCCNIVNGDGEVEDAAAGSAGG